MIGAMATHIAFLRAINLGAKRKFPKGDVRAAVERAGFTGVETYLNTGNVRFESSLRSRAKISAALEAAFLEAAGFEVPTVVLTPAELRAVVADAATLAEDRRGQHFVSLLKQVPSAEQAEAFERLGRDGEVARVLGGAAHLLVGESYHQARLTNATVERHLGVATNRNLTVLRTLADKWC